MPMINLPTGPTAPALGKSSSAITQGYIDSELQPFVQMGGSIEGADPGINLAGGTRLGRHMFLRGPEEQKKIMENIRTNKLNQFVNQLLGEGFTKQSATRLQRGNQYVDINWLTGEYSEGGNEPVSVMKSKSSGGDQLAARFNTLQGIESGKIQASASSTAKLREQLGISAPVQYGSASIYGNTTTTNKSSGSSGSSGSSKTTTTSAPSYANGQLTFSGGTTPSVPKVNVNSNVSKAIGTTYTATPVKTTTVVVKAPTVSSKIGSAINTSLSNSKIGQVTKTISSLIKKKK